MYSGRLLCYYKTMKQSIYISVDHNLKTPIYLQIATGVRNLILSGTLPPGCTLPSERTLAQQLSVHRNTVVKAYNELKADGVITSSQGRGYTVEGSLKAENFQGSKSKAVNWTSQIKNEFQDMEVTFDRLYEKSSDTKSISLGSGIASPDIFNVERVAEDIANILNSKDSGLYFYSTHKGDRELRKQLGFFLASKGIDAGTSEIQVLKETNQAMDYIVTLLLSPGDYVIMEEPVSPDVFRAVELAGGKILTLPVDEEGMRVDMLEPLVIQYKPRFIFVNASFHDPTGALLSEKRKKKILEISYKYRVPVVEEDAASELVYEGDRVLPIKAYDYLNNVIYIYSFQLTFMPGVSLTFVVADKMLIENLGALVSVRMVANDWLPQKLLAGYLKDGSYYTMMDKLREDYGTKQALMCRKLDKMKDLGIEYSRPKGGVYIWCKLPDGVDSRELTQVARRRGIVLLPGHVFFPKKNGGRNYLRLNYSFEPLERLDSGMDILKESIEEILAHEKSK